MLALFYCAIFVMAPTLFLTLVHQSMFGFHPLQAALALFCSINTMICIWEWVLFFHRGRIQKEWMAFKERLPARTMPWPIFLFQDISMSQALSLKYWSLVWSTYSLLDPRYTSASTICYPTSRELIRGSYSDQTTFGFWVDSGNGIVTFPPTLLFAWAMTFAKSYARAIGTISIIIFYQELYGTVIYFSSYIVNQRYKGHSTGNVFTVAFSNGIWILFPAIGMWASWQMVSSNTFNVFRL